GTRSNRARPRGGGGETDDAHEVLHESRVHADVSELPGEAHEAPEAANGRPGGTHEREGGERGGRDPTEQDRREPGAQRKGDEEHQAHRGEGVDGVVEYLREEPDPQDLETEA